MPRHQESAADRLATKKLNQRLHFKQRARQRFGLVLTAAEVATIIWRIKQDKPGVVFLRLQRGASAWRVKHRHHTLVMIYDHRTEQLVTAYGCKRWKYE